MPTIPNFPSALLHKHHAWHQPGPNLPFPGRAAPQGTPGSGIEFLAFHRAFMAEFHEWYHSQPAHDHAAVAPWSAIPAALKQAMFGWNGRWAADENRLMDSAGFATADELGIFIETGIHNQFLHSATAAWTGEAILGMAHSSPLSTYFYQLHGLVDHWWALWLSRHPLSRANSGTFNTQEVWPWSVPQLAHSKAVAFSPPFVAPPRLAIGLNSLDVDHSANVRVRAHATDITEAGFNVHVNTWADTKLYSGGCTWFEAGPADEDILVGEFNTTEDHPWNRPQGKTSRRINFTRPFSDGGPHVVVWLNTLDLDSADNARVHAYASNVDPTGFTAHIDTWGNTQLFSAAISWIAYPKGKPGIAHGTFNTQDVRPWNQPQLATAGSASFPVAFETPPRVWVALNSLDAGQGKNLRINATCDQVTRSGLIWHLDTWGDTALYSAGASYIAIG
jgi:hypothetical protein